MAKREKVVVEAVVTDDGGVAEAVAKAKDLMKKELANSGLPEETQAEILSGFGAKD